MRAWHDLNERLEGNFYTTSKTQYFIDKGVKIEKHLNGRIKIYTTLEGESFKPIDKEQWTIFYLYGWEAGVRRVLYDHYSELFAEDIRKGRPVEENKRKCAQHLKVYMELVK